MSAAEKLNAHLSSAFGWVSLAAFARDVLCVKAKNYGRAGRDWCQSRGVPYIRDGKTNWARIDDIRVALDAMKKVPANDAQVPDFNEWR